MAKKILIHSLIFSPDGVSTAYLYNDIALAFKQAGYEVVVLTTTPHYNIVEEQLAKQPMKWKVWGFCKESSFQGIRVLHVPQKKFKSTLLRLLGFVYWHIVSFLIALFQTKVDLILSPSPPLTIGLLNLALGKIKGCKVVYNVQEIYPDILGKKEGLVYKVLSKMEHCVYNHSDAVTTIDQVFYDTIVGRFKDTSKLHIIPNFVDTELYHPEAGKQMHLDTSLFPETDHLKIVYAGNIGFAQDWDPLIDLIEATREEPIDYFVIGEGVKKTYLEEQKEKLSLSSLHILPYQPRELMPAILAYSDLQFIFMSKQMQMQGFPSKVYTIMACAKPLLVCSAKGTPIVNFLSAYHCAKLITETEGDRKVCEMVHWLKQVTKEKLAEMGSSGEKVIQQEYAKQIVTKKYVDLLASL